MFIELTEYLRCPAAHDPAWLVLAPATMAGRHVVAGALGCPVCHAEYAIRDGVVVFGTAPARAAPSTFAPAPDVVQALIGLESPGGYVALAGSAAALAPPLTPLMPGVHFVTVNALGDPGPAASRLQATSGLPLRDRTMRCVVLGAEAIDLIGDAQRVVLTGQRVVALREDVSPPDRLEELARGQGMWVGRRAR